MRSLLLVSWLRLRRMGRRLPLRLRVGSTHRPLHYPLLWMRSSLYLRRRLMSRRIHVPRLLRWSRVLRHGRTSGNMLLRSGSMTVVRRGARVRRSRVVLMV